MGNMCQCPTRQPIIAQLPTSSSTINKPISNFHISQPQIQAIQQSKGRRQTSEIKINTSKLNQSQKRNSIIRKGSGWHKLVVDPPSEHDHGKFQKLELLSQVPSQFFNNINMSTYFKLGKSQKSNASQAFSFKHGRLLTKNSRQQTFQPNDNVNVLIRTNDKQTALNDVNETARHSRSQIKHTDTTNNNGSVLRTTTRSMLPAQTTSSLLNHSTIKKLK